MRIALMAHVRQPIAEPFMGGMEAHTWHLAKGLEARGHRVTVFASGDSDPDLEISPILDEHYERTFPGPSIATTPRWSLTSIAASRSPARASRAAIST